MNVFTCPRSSLREQVQRASRHGVPVRWPCSTLRHSNGLEVLARPPEARSEPFVLLTLGEEPTPPPSESHDCQAVLHIGRQQRGTLAGRVRTPAGWQPLDQVKIIGPGMHVLDLHPLREAAGPGPAVRERWSRTVGALGPEVHARLTQHRYAVVGVGRTGSVLAEAVAGGWGVERMTLIDADTVEPHNLGEMAGLREGDRGRPKVHAMAEHLRAPGREFPAVTPLPHSVTDVRALHAVLACDVVMSCVDQDGARLATAALASLFLKPHLDVATGIHGRGAGRRLGTDIRLTVPGDGRCLLCLGGLAEAEAARRLLASAEAERTVLASQVWDAQRTGSLRSLNMVAVGLALRLWEDFVSERVPGSTWLRLEFDTSGRLAVRYVDPPVRRDCPLCAQAGAGGEGLPQVRVLFRHG
jgi:hypothetical protein